MKKNLENQKLLSVNKSFVMEPFYIRDGRAPIPVKNSTSRVMSANKSKNTLPELTLRKALWLNGIRGYRLHWKKVVGNPDIAFPSKKIAVFVNGCFWHRCPNCQPSYPKTNEIFWGNKFANNIERDKQIKEQLENSGWKVIVIWECEIKKDILKSVIQIKDSITQKEFQRRGVNG